MFFITPRRSDAPLGDVASEVFRALGIAESEERDSMNFPPDGHYFAGYSDNAEVIVYDADDDRTPDYPFRVSVGDSRRHKGAGIIKTDLTSVANSLVAVGFTVFVPAGAWEQIDWDGAGDVYTA